MPQKTIFFLNQSIYSEYHVELVNYRNNKVIVITINMSFFFYVRELLISFPFIIYYHKTRSAALHEDFQSRPLTLKSNTISVYIYIYI